MKVIRETSEPKPYEYVTSSKIIHGLYVDYIVEDTVTGELSKDRRYVPQRQYYRDKNKKYGLERYVR